MRVGRSKSGETGVRHVSWRVNQAAHGMSNIQLHVMVVGGVLRRWSRRLDLRRQVISFGGLVVEAEPRSGRA